MILTVLCYLKTLEKKFIIVTFFRLKTEVASNTTTVTIHVEWTVSRKTDAKDTSEVTTTVRNIELLPYVNGEFNPVRQTLVDMLNENSNATNATIILRSAFPKFLKVTARTTSVVRQLMQPLRLRKYN